MSDAFSFSRLMSWWRCPFAYKLQYIDGIPRSSGAAADAGAINHLFFEKYAQHCIKNNTSTDLDYGRSLINEMVIGLDPSLAMDVRFIMEKFLDTHAYPRPAFIEEKIALSWRPRLKRWERVPFNSPRAIYRGVIDYLEPRKIDGYVLILDYKTGRVLPERTAIQDDFQLWSYALMASVLFPDIHRYACVLDYVRYNLIYDPVEITRSQADEFGKSIVNTSLDIKHAIKNNNFPIKYRGARCDLCDYMHRCPEYKKAIVMTDLPDDPVDKETVIDLAVYANMLKAAGSRFDKIVRKYVDANGALMIGDKELDFRPIEKRSFPNTQGVVNALIKLGIERQDIWDSMSLTFKSIQALAKKYDLSDDDLAPLMKLCDKNIELQFRMKKVEKAS